MVPDHACVPGLDRAVTVSEYAQLEGLREADVLAVVGQLKIPAAYFRGQWFVEAPPGCGFVVWYKVVSLLDEITARAGQ